MEKAIGFNIICLVITIVCIIPAYDLTLKDKIVFIVGEMLLMALLTVGTCLMVL